MVGSLARYGQLSPVVVCLREEQLELLDGFKRLTAARQVPDLAVLRARRLDVDEREAKASLLGLNGISGRVKELEEAWNVQALVREDRFSPVEVAELLGRHKSWVCRRLVLLEKLSSPAAPGPAALGLCHCAAPGTSPPKNAWQAVPVPRTALAARPPSAADPRGDDAPAARCARSSSCGAAEDGRR